MKNSLLKAFSSALFLLIATPALTQSLVIQMKEWDALPENAAMREACSTSLRYASSLENLRKQGGTVVSLLKWSGQEAERSAAQLPTEPLLPIGTQMIITKQIRLLYTAGPIYSLVQGGFPQWVYRSCLKGKPVD